MRRYVTRALASADWDVHHAGFDSLQIAGQTSVWRQLFLIDADAEPAAVLGLLQQIDSACNGGPRPATLLISQDTDNRLLIDLLGERGLNHFVARHTGMAAHQDMIDEGELIVTCQKLLTGDIYGLQKYLPTWGMKVHHHRVTSLEDKFTSMAALEAFLNRIDCFSGVIPAVSLVAEELLMNAIFNAPRDDQGHAKYSTIDRSTMLKLEPHEYSDFEFACDGRYVGLSVRDPFGSLSRAAIVKYLERCFLGQRGQIEEKRAGAGLGLYMVFNSITQLIFNIDVGRHTEVVALFYVRSGARAFRRSGRSLNIFMLDS